MSIVQAVLDLVLPPRCPACDRPSVTTLCVACAEATEALVLDDLGAVGLADGVTAIGAFSYAGVVRRAIHAVKIAGRHAAAPGLGRLLWHVVGFPDRRPWPVTWVPSTPRRLRERGVEVPQLLAGQGAVPLLSRIAERPDQTTLDASARRRAPVGVFVARRAAPERVALVDDVRTTGATATAAASALVEAGAREVLVVTLAVTGPADVDIAARSPSPGLVRQP